MNYEQKYKNALEKLQEALAPTKDGCKICGLTRGCIENIFPELQENESEKMKKAIIHILYENYTDAAVIEGVEIAEIVTWLEEQGKKKSADEVLKIRQELYQSGYNDGYKHGQEDAAISLEKESIEVDERIRKVLLNDFKNNCSEYYCEGVDRDMIIAWLEKQEKQKQTWRPSEAQLIVIEDLINDKNTSNVSKTILRGMLDEFKQFTNNYKRETDSYETEDSSQT